MLGKVIKYEIIGVLKKFNLFFVACIAIALLSKLFTALADRTILFSTISGMLSVIVIILSFGSIIYLFMIMIRRFYLNVFKHEGYLTNTLPIKKKDILISNLIVSTMFTIATLIVSLLSLWIAFGNDNIWNIITTYVNEISNVLNLSVFSLVTFAVVMIVLTIVSNIQFFITSLSLGHIGNTSKLTMSVVWGILLYTMMQTLSLLGLGIYYAFRRDLFNSLANSHAIDITNNYEMTFLKEMMIMGLIITIITMIIYFIISRYALEKKLNLD